MNLFEKICRRLLVEAAESSGEELSAKIVKRVEKAYSENLALCDLSPGKGRQIFVLYQPGDVSSFMSNFMRGLQSVVSEDDKKKLLSFLRTKFIKKVVGTVDITVPKTAITGKCHGASMVQFSAADQGYGPMLYDIAMTFAPNGKIMSDRFSVTNQAADYYKRLADRPDIVAEPFKKITGKNVKDPDACRVWGENFPERSFLDHAYSRKTDFDATSLLDNHERAVEAIEELVAEIGIIPPRDVDSTIRSGLKAASTRFFTSTYKTVRHRDIVSIRDRSPAIRWLPLNLGSNTKT